MLRFTPGSDPAPQNTHSFRAALLALATFAALVIAPSISAAATYQTDLFDPDGSGFGASVLFDDAIDPGNLTITIDSLPAGSGGDIMAFSLNYSVEAFFPGTIASGTDIGSNRAWFNGPSRSNPCPCNLLGNVGTSDIFELTGVTSTVITLDHPTETISLDALAGATFRVFLGFSPDHVDAPGKLIRGVRALKVDGEIPVIPEPSTAAMMLLGLMGLAGGSRRLERQV